MPALQSCCYGGAAVQACSLQQEPPTPSLTACACAWGAAHWEVTASFHFMGTLHKRAHSSPEALMLVASADPPMVRRPTGCLLAQPSRAHSIKCSHLDTELTDVSPGCCGASGLPAPQHRRGSRRRGRPAGQEPVRRQCRRTLPQRTAPAGAHGVLLAAPLQRGARLTSSQRCIELRVAIKIPARWCCQSGDHDNVSCGCCESARTCRSLQCGSVTASCSHEVAGSVATCEPRSTRWYRRAMRRVSSSPLQGSRTSTAARSFRGRWSCCTRRSA